MNMKTLHSAMYNFFSKKIFLLLKSNNQNQFTKNTNHYMALDYPYVSIPKWRGKQQFRWTIMPL